MSPNVSKRGRADLCQVFADLGFCDGAEVGVWTGQFSKKLCKAIPGLDLLCVDPWCAYDEYREEKNNAERLEAAYREALVRLAPYRCTIWRTTSLEAASRVPDRSLDFVYIDGNHRRPFVDQDLEAWAPKVRIGGIVAGHDYSERAHEPFIEVKAAVDAFVRKHAIDPWFVLAGDKAPSFYWVVG